MRAFAVAPFVGILRRSSAIDAVRRARARAHVWRFLATAVAVAVARAHTHCRLADFVIQANSFSVRAVCVSIIYRAAAAAAAAAASAAAAKQSD